MRSRPQAVEEFLQKVGSRKKGVVPRKHLVPFMQQNSEPSLASSLLFSWAVRPDWRVLHGRCALYSRGGELIILDVPAICSVMTSSLSLTQRSCPTPSTPRCSLEGGARSASLRSEGVLAAGPPSTCEQKHRDVMTQASPHSGERPPAREAETTLCPPRRAVPECPPHEEDGGRST